MGALVGVGCGPLWPMSGSSAPDFVQVDTAAALNRYLDAWAGSYLVDADAWASVVDRGNTWLDLSGRNQVMLAAQGLATPVAGSRTWETIPSREPDRGCAIRAGEEPAYIRVPLVDGSQREVRSLRSATARAVSRTEASDFEWVPVFGAEQLVRVPGQRLVWPQLPESQRGDRSWREKVRLATRMAASGGFLARSMPADQMLATAGAVLTGDETLGAQVSWLVSARFGRQVGELPAFDPSALTPAERRLAVIEVRAAVTKLVQGLGDRFGFDMRQGPLPRLGSDDLRVLPGRLNYLPKAVLAEMTVGVFQQQGPFSAQEWAHRGRDGVAGVAAFCKVTERGYLAVYERVEGGYEWALETVGGTKHRGRVAAGVEPSMEAAKTAARSELERSYPSVAAQLVDAVGSPVVSPEMGWVGVGDDGRVFQRVYNDRVSAMVAPGPGGRWFATVHVDNAVAQRLPLEGSQHDAQRAADRGAVGEMLTLAAEVPARADELIASSARSGDWDRSLLDQLVVPSLSADDGRELMTGLEAGSVSAQRVVELLTATANVGPETSLAVVKAEGFGVADAVTAIDDTGLSRPGSVAAIARMWGASVDRVAEMAGLSVEEFMLVGPTAAQLLRFDPRAGLRTLPVEPGRWHQAGQDLVAAGYGTAAALRVVAAHGASPATIAAGAYGVTENPTEALQVLATEVTPADLVVVGSEYELDATDLVREVNQSGAGLAVVAAVAVESARRLDPERSDPEIVDAGWKLVTAAHRDAGVSSPSRQLFDEVLAPDVSTTRQVESPEVANNVIDLELRR